MEPKSWAVCPYKKRPQRAPTPLAPGEGPARWCRDPGGGPSPGSSVPGLGPGRGLQNWETPVCAAEAPRLRDRSQVQGRSETPPAPLPSETLSTLSCPGRGDLGDHRERHGHPQCLSFSQPTPSHPAKPQVLWSQPRPQFSRLSAPPHSQLCGQSPLASAFAVPAGVFRGPSLTTPTGPVKPEPASARRPPRSSLQHTSCPVTPLHGNPVPRRLPVRDALS